MMPLRTMLSRAARSGLNPTPSSISVDMRPRRQMQPSDAVDAGEALQQRALAAAVAAGDAEELALVNRERDIGERAERLIRHAPPRVQRALLERVKALFGDTERLSHPVGDHRRQPLLRISMHVRRG